MLGFRRRKNAKLIQARNKVTDIGCGLSWLERLGGPKAALLRSAAVRDDVACAKCRLCGEEGEGAR